MSKIGYIRVSTEHQETARQEEMMRQADVDRLFIEKASGKTTERQELKKLMLYLREEDVLFIESLSRLGRSTRDLLQIVDELNQKGVKLVSMKENIDTQTPRGRFVLAVFASLSELEREQTLQRQREGIAVAKKAGKYKGRKFKKIDETLFKKLYSKWKNHEITAVSFAQKIGLLPNAFYRRIRRYESTLKIN